MSFNHTYFIQPAVAVIDAVLRTADDLMHVLKGQPIVKGETRAAVDLLMDIFKKVGGTKKSLMDIHQDDMAKSTANRANSEYDKEEGIWTIPQVEQAQVGDVQTYTAPQITHPTRNKPNVIPE